MSFPTENPNYAALSLKLDRRFRSYCVHAAGELGQHVYWDTHNGGSFRSPLPLGPWAWTVLFAQSYIFIKDKWPEIAWRHKGGLLNFDRKKIYPYHFPEAAQIQPA